MREPIFNICRRTCHALGLALVAVVCVALLMPASARAQDDETLITSDGVGGVEIGTTIDELRDSLDGYQISDDIRLTVDLRGHTVSRDGRVAFRAAQVVPDSPQIELFIVSSDVFRTAEGVGPGTSIAEAVEQYGKATFMLDRNNSGREFVVFADQPEGSIAFRTFGIAGAYVGEYAGDATMTTSFQEDAAIASVWIGCTSRKACIRNGAASIDDESAPAVSDTVSDTERSDTTEDEAAEANENVADDPAVSDPVSDTQQEDEVLAETGIAQTRQLALVSALILLGTCLVVLERRYGLGPEWLR